MLPPALDSQHHMLRTLRRWCQRHDPNEVAKFSIGDNESSAQRRARNREHRSRQTIDRSRRAAKLKGLTRVEKAQLRLAERMEKKSRGI